MLVRVDTGATCSACHTRYPAAPDGQLDLRLKAPKRYKLEVPLGEEWFKDSFEFGRIKPNPSPQFDVNGVRFHRGLTYGNRLTRELLSHFPRASSPGGLMLDLGCDHRDFAEACGGTNLEYVGLDCQGIKPDLLGDAHSLPFRDNVFEFVMSIAVLEHLRHPLVAMREVHRVLRPGGLFIGTVAFLEPFHQDSFYNHTHLGTYNSLASAGLVVRQIEPNMNWTGIQAIAMMSGLPDLPGKATNLLLWLLRALGRVWRTVQNIRGKSHGSRELLRQLSTTGGFRFIAIKPVSTPEQQVQPQ
jgi:SAM-dependent methyltransferase